jgi:hypothetical protein
MDREHAYAIGGALSYALHPIWDKPKNKLWLLLPVPLFCRAAGPLEGCCRARAFITTTTAHQRNSTGMDKASRELAKALPLGIPFSFRSLAHHSGINFALVVKSH